MFRPTDERREHGGPRGTGMHGDGTPGAQRDIERSSSGMALLLFVFVNRWQSHLVMRPRRVGTRYEDTGDQILTATSSKAVLRLILRIQSD